MKRYRCNWLHVCLPSKRYGVQVPDTAFLFYHFSVKLVEIFAIYAYNYLMSKEPKIFEITPQSLAEMKFLFSPSEVGETGLAFVLISLIESIAKEKGWDLNNVIFEYKGEKYKGMQQVPETSVYDELKLSKE